MHLLAETDGPTVMFLIALAVTTGLLLFRTQRQLGSRPKMEHPSQWRKPPAPARPAQAMAGHADLRQWEVQMHDLARELCGRLDSKIGIVENLIRESRSEAARLGAVIERAERAAAAIEHQALAAGEPAGLWPTRQVDPPHVSHQAAALGGGPRREGSLDAQGAARVDGSAAKSAGRYEEVYALADAGHASAAIAERLGSPVGEVELILGLRDQHLKRTASRAPASSDRRLVPPIT